MLLFIGFPARMSCVEALRGGVFSVAQIDLREESRSEHIFSQVFAQDMLSSQKALLLS